MARDKPMTKVTSAEFQKQFGRYRETAQREAVMITSHGRESLVLVSAEEYRRLKALDLRRAVYAQELPEALGAALDKAAPPAWTDQFDSEMTQ